jgi:hypothetical protein
VVLRVRDVIVMGPLLMAQRIRRSNEMAQRQRLADHRRTGSMTNRRRRAQLLHELQLKRDARP